MIRLPMSPILLSAIATLAAFLVIQTGFADEPRRKAPIPRRVEVAMQVLAEGITTCKTLCRAANLTDAWLKLYEQKHGHRKIALSGVLNDMEGSEFGVKNAILACKKLSEHGHRAGAAVPILLKELQTPFPNPRSAASSELAHVGHRCRLRAASVSALVAIHDKRQNVAEAIGKALEEMRSARKKYERILAENAASRGSGSILESGYIVLKEHETDRVWNPLHVTLLTAVGNCGQRLDHWRWRFLRISVIRIPKYGWPQ